MPWRRSWPPNWRPASGCTARSSAPASSALSPPAAAVSSSTSSSAPESSSGIRDRRGRQACGRLRGRARRASSFGVRRVHRRHRLPRAGQKLEEAGARGGRRLRRDDGRNHHLRAGFGPQPQRRPQHDGRRRLLRRWRHLAGPRWFGRLGDVRASGSGTPDSGSPDDSGADDAPATGPSGGPQDETTSPSTGESGAATPSPTPTPSATGSEEAGSTAPGASPTPPEPAASSRSGTADQDRDDPAAP